MSAPTPPTGPSDSIIILKIIGQIFFIAGVFGLWCFYKDKGNGIFISGIGVLAGILLMFLPRDTPTPPPTE